MAREDGEAGPALPSPVGTWLSVFFLLMEGGHFRPDFHEFCELALQSVMKCGSGYHCFWKV